MRRPSPIKVGESMVLRFCRHLSLFLLIIVFVIILQGCDETESVSPYQPSIPPSAESVRIDTVITPEFWVYQSSNFRNLEVQLDIDQATAAGILEGMYSAPVIGGLITWSDGAGGENFFSFPVLDDGGNGDLSGYGEAVYPSSGDLIPGDFHYIVKINSLFAPDSGFYRVVYSIDLGEPGSVIDHLDSLYVAYNEAPVVDSLDLPDSLHSGFDAVTLIAFIHDPDSLAGDVIDSTALYIINEDDTTRTVQLNEDNEFGWSLMIDSTFAAALPTDDYTFSLRVWDQFEVPSEPAEYSVWIENTAPALDNLVSPDTVYAALEDTNRYLVTIEVLDFQGQQDIEEVYFEVRQPGDINWVSDDSFVLTDTGIEPDTLIGDGVWSNWIVTYPTATVFGPYDFRFLALDRAGNLSEPLETVIVQVQEQPGGGQ